MRNELYYTLNYQERSIELDFSQLIDSSTINGNISFSDQDMVYDTQFRLIYSGRKIILAFHPGFHLKDGWRYYITIKTGLRSNKGITLRSETKIELRTSSRLLPLENDSTFRDAIICISDIHMGNQKALTLGYCWFNKNEAALESLLDLVNSSPQVKQLVILGDLFDEWVVPYRISPFDSAAAIRDTRDYFFSIANTAKNINIINKLKSIASGGTVQLVYIPGNHDMLLTPEILQDIIPGIIWQGNVTGLGHYSPLSEMIMEHGHRYDFFNCPQPLTNPGHILPPGYFISRLDAEGLMNLTGQKDFPPKSGKSSVEFITAWTAAVEYLKFHYSLTVAEDSTNILMGGIDGFINPQSFNGERNQYASNIENEWPSTQISNAVPVPMPAIMAIVNGSLDLSFAASYEYMESQAPKRFKIVAFGHTHHPMISVYPQGKSYTGIYANTGSWVNADLCNYPVRTFLVIRPAQWTGSELDFVSLYQYNLNSGSGNPDPGYVPVLISEESIEP